MEFSDYFSLKGKTALVTGARTGIGQAIAHGFAKAGADLLLLGHQDNMTETEALVQKEGRDFKTILMDLSSPELVITEAEKYFKNERIDILVNNAGMIKRSPALDYSVEDWTSVMNTNIHSLFSLTQVIGRQMVERREGKIINIASLLSFQGGVFVPAYTASKHAVAGLTKALANEWASYNIQVNAIAPGYIKTNNTEDLLKDEKRAAAILERIPAARWGETQDLAGAAIYLASRASNYVNGHLLTVDGGWMGR